MYLNQWEERDSCVFCGVILYYKHEPFLIVVTERVEHMGTDAGKQVNVGPLEILFSWLLFFFMK